MCLGTRGSTASHLCCNLLFLRHPGRPKAANLGHPAMIKSPNMNDPHWVIVVGFELLDDGKEYVKVRDPGTGDAWHVPFVDFGNLFLESSSQAISF